MIAAPAETRTSPECQLPPHVYRGHRTLSIMPTFGCPAACNDCGTLSSPRDRTRLDLETISAALHEARKLGFYNVVFTGGEATMRWDDLLASIRLARDLRFPVRLVTNAHWARDRTVAAAKLDLLIEAGLSEINYSTGDEHVRFVPLEHVVNAIVAACERSFRVHVMIELRGRSSLGEDDVRRHPCVEALTAEQLKWLAVSPSPWMPLNHETVDNYPEDLATTRRNLASRGGCASVLRDYTLQADGRVGACCGLGLRLIPELNVATVKQRDFLRAAIAESEEDFLKLWIHYQGPERIVAWAASKNPSIEWEGFYAHRCQACHRLYKDDAIRAVVRDHWREVVGEVVQCAWLDEVFVPEALSRSCKTKRAEAQVVGSAVGSA